MATLEEFKALRAGVAPEVQTELGNLAYTDPEVALSRMIEIASEKGMALTTEEVRGFLSRWTTRKSSMTSSWMRLPLLPLLVVEVGHRGTDPQAVVAEP